MRFDRLLAPLVAALLLSGSSAALAAAEPMDPERAPKTEGPLTLEDTACNERSVRSDDGDLLGRAEVCVFLYNFDFLSETDLTRDHGAAWMQARFTPVDGWCATDLGGRLEVAGATLESNSKGTVRRGRALVTMPVTAGDSALEDGRISQAWASRTPIAHTNVLRTDDAAVKIVWKGRSAGPVELVGGLAYSYDILSAPAEISFGVSDLTLATC